MKKYTLKLIILIAVIFFAQPSSAQFTTTGSDIYYNTGKVGIGTTAAPVANATLQVLSGTNSGVVIGAAAYPSYLGTNGLLVEGGFRAASYIVNSASRINWGASQAYVGGYNPSTGSDTYLFFGTGATERMRLDNSGNLGIGTTTPTAKLHVVGNMLVTDVISALNFSIKSSGLCVGTYTGNGTATSATNIIMGYGSGMGLTTGGYNNIIGFGIANNMTTGYRNTIIGGLSTNWNISTAQDITSGFDNTLIGNGAGARLSTAGYCVGIGSGALSSNGASNYNTAIGYSAGFSNYAGTANTFLGCSAGGPNTTGSNNVVIGYNSGRSNTTGSGLTFVGTSAGFSGTSDGLSNATAIGYNAQVAQSNSLILGAGVNVGIGTTTPGELLSLGKTGSTKGVLSFSGNTSGKVIVQPAAAAGTWTMTLPTTAGSSGYVLQTDGTGITSWVAAPSGGTFSGNTLPANIVGSSLTSVGTISAGTWNGSSIAPAFGGTGTTTAFTPGSLVFAGASGVYSQDNANLFWNSTTQQLTIGTTTAPAGYKLAVKGNVIAETMKVQISSGWGDYVFDKDYKLMPLQQVESYVKQNHHLPEVPSAAEIKQQGLDLGEINKQLTKKVEELTLYIIEQNKQIKQQQTAQDAQATDIAELKKQLTELMSKK